jgi:hypothetical protein
MGTSRYMKEQLLLNKIREKTNEIDESLSTLPVAGAKGGRLGPKKSKERAQSWQKVIQDAEEFIVPVEKSLGIRVAPHVEEEESKEEKIESAPLTAPVKVALSNFYYNMLIAYIYRWTPLKNYSEIPYSEEEYRRDESAWLRYEKQYFAWSEDKDRPEKIEYFKQVRNGYWDEKAQCQYDPLFHTLEKNRKFYAEIDALRRKGIKALKKPDNKLAIECFESALTKYHTIPLTTEGASYYEQAGEALAIRYLWTKRAYAKALYLSERHDEAREIYEELVKKRLFDKLFFKSYINFCDADNTPELIPHLKLLAEKYKAAESTCSGEPVLDCPELDKAILDEQAKRSEIAAAKKIAEEKLIGSLPPEEKARALYFAGNYEGAREIYEELIKKRLFTKRFFENYRLFCQADHAPANLIEQLNLLEEKYNHAKSTCSDELVLDCSELDKAVLEARAKRPEIEAAQKVYHQAMRDEKSVLPEEKAKAYAILGYAKPAKTQLPEAEGAKDIKEDKKEEPVESQKKVTGKRKVKTTGDSSEKRESEEGIKVIKTRSMSKTTQSSSTFFSKPQTPSKKKHKPQRASRLPEFR